ncbi:U-box domain-containing protein 13 [Nymphaea thermarum]|nr:U-box domain-containing protein 13 [Nymphaea thermarum]
MDSGGKDFKVGSLLHLRDLNGSAAGMEDPDGTIATVAELIEHLHANMSSPHEKELITSRLLGLAKLRKDARIAIGSHCQAMPLFIAVLRNGTSIARVNVALTLSALCKEDDLRVRVLLGGCIPPLLALLKSDASEARKAAAEAIYEVSSGGLTDDHVGMKIFVTEGVVPTLWDQLDPMIKQDKVVEGFVTGALRNLCGDKDDYWRATLEAGGVEIIVELLSSDNLVAQSNAASLLARLMLAFSDSIPKVIEAGAVRSLLHLLCRDNDISVRASASDALEALSCKSSSAKKAVVDANGIPVLIGAIVAPSKEAMQGGCGQILQDHSVHALANICGGMPSLIMQLGEMSISSRMPSPFTDIIGALAYALMVFDESSGKLEPFDVMQIESLLMKLLKPRDSKLVQERVFEALASLYGNSYLSRGLTHAEAKKMLVGLVTMAADEVQEDLIHYLTNLCSGDMGIWESFGKREGIQLLISLLGLSGEQHQEYAVTLLSILTLQVDESKWAITAAGGIPPLVQLLETGSHKAKEEAAHVLWNLCSHSEDIRACVESAGAVPSLLWLLKSAGPKGQQASAMALTKLIRYADAATVNQLLALLLGELPSSKAHVITVLGHVLTVASHRDLVQKGAPANRGLRTLVQVLNSSNEETQEHAASVLADLFSMRQDICGNLATDEIVHPCIKLLTSKTQVIATQSARALGALSRPAKSTNKMSYIAEGDVYPLIKLAKTSSIDAAETAVAALANLLSDPQIAGEAIVEDIVSPLIKVLSEGTMEGKKNASRALYQLLHHFPVGDVLTSIAECRFTIFALVSLLAATNVEGADSSDILDVLALLARTKQCVNSSYHPWSALAESPSGLEPLVRCLAVGLPPMQDKAIEILSRLCSDQLALLGDLLGRSTQCVFSLAERIVESSSLEIQVGGVSLLICATKDHTNNVVDSLDESGCLKQLIYSLIQMVKCYSLPGTLQFRRAESEVGRATGVVMDKSAQFREGDDFEAPDPAIILGGTVSLWLLSLISSFHLKSKTVIMEAGGLDVLSDKLTSLTQNSQAQVEDSEGVWINALLLAVMFQDENVCLSPAIMRIIPSLASLLKSDEVIDRYFAAQAIASLVSNGNKGTLLAVANSGAVGGLITLIGTSESDMLNLVTLCEEFSLAHHPDQVILERLFEMEDVRVGATARKSIPLLVDLLRPMPDRPGAPPIAVHLLALLAEGSDTNKLAMSEVGVLEALTKYLSLSPQDSTETTISDLFRILFSNPDLLHHEASQNSLNQLVAVLRLGSRNARYSSARALQKLFDAENIREMETAKQSIQPLVDMLDTGSEKEQHAALIALVKLFSGNTAKALALMEVEGSPLESLHKILSNPCSVDLKKNAAELCFLLFGNAKLRALPIATECLPPLISLMGSNVSEVVHSSVHAFERLLEDEPHAELAASFEVVDLLVGLVSGSNYALMETAISALIKLGKDRPHCKLDMVKAGIVECSLELLPVAPSSFCSSIAELLRILTNNSGIARSSTAAMMVEPLFLLLLRPDFSMWGQHSALQALVNILEKPQSLDTLKLTPNQVVGPLISFLESPSQAIQQLGTELLSHLLAQEDFQQDITTQSAVVPLVQLAGIGILNLQQTAVKALESISMSWPTAVADAGGIFELSKVIIQEDPQPPHALWESSALVLSNVLRSNSHYYFKVSHVVLVRMLHSSLEETVTVALNALIVQERNDASCAVVLAEAGAIDALLELLRSHQCEEAAGRLLEAIFNNARVRGMKVSKYAIAPLSDYLSDPQTSSQPARLLAALALGDLFQNEGLARASDAASACNAFIRLLEDQPTEEMKMVAVCALQNLVMNSRTNRRAVAEAGGILVIQELLMSPNYEVVGQAALLIKFLFSNHTLQEYVSNELIRSLTAALGKELLSRETINVEILRAINMIFTNFSKLHISEAATLCIPHLIGALKAGPEAAQECVLDTLCLLKQSWSTMPIDIAKAQAIIASEAIPVLQMLMKTCPPSFHDRADSLLHCLPGCLTVTIKRGNNLKLTMGSTNAFCRLTIGNGPPRQTKVVNHSTCPEWEEAFKWAFDVPPKGQKLHILCKSKSTFGKTTLGRVTIQIDKVVTEGIFSGFFNLNHDANRDGSSGRKLEIEILWSNRERPNDSL